MNGCLAGWVDIILNFTFVICYYFVNIFIIIIIIISSEAEPVESAALVPSLVAFPGSRLLH